MKIKGDSGLQNKPYVRKNKYFYYYATGTEKKKKP